MSALSIREATPDDIPALSLLAARSWADAFGRYFSAEDRAADFAARRSQASFATALETSVVLVAERAGVLAGYAMFGPVHTPEARGTEHDRELDRLYVASELHGQGIGARLLTAALAHPELAGAERVFLNVFRDNARAVQLYRRFGFAVVGTSAYRIGTAMSEDVLMMRPQVPAPSSR